MLLNMGGCETLEGISDYLTNIFTDPDVVQLPFSRQSLIFIPSNSVTGRLLAIRRKSTVVEYYKFLVDKLRDLIRDFESYDDKPPVILFTAHSIPLKWMVPSVNKMLTGLAKNGYQNIILAPIVFAADCSETLYELDILYRSLATKVVLDNFNEF
ncbi:ferrochelatase-like [Octopus sinensis]|uniref:Ferrochelatase-like n=1 Tax=Octopus sinensis TaxID=2607531 RepID=A0A6P7U247_9MOLL|nr:ferrochelatase-like [Octopus sinensis]